MPRPEKYNPLEDPEVVQRMGVTAHYLVCSESEEYDDTVDEDFEDQDEDHQADDYTNGLLFVAELMNLGCKITRKQVGLDKT